MRSILTVVPGALVLSLALGACSDQPVLPLQASASQGGANPIVLSVKGSGHLTAVGTGPVYGGEEGWRSFTVNATMRADGSVSGTTQYNSRINGGSVQQAKVVCMQDLSGYAGGAYAGWVAVGAEVTHRVSDFAPSPFPPFPAAIVGVDHGIVFLVKDNGEGASALPDQLTLAANTRMLFVNRVCAGVYNALVPGLIATAATAIEAGNIQIRFGD